MKKILKISMFGFALSALIFAAPALTPKASAAIVLNAETAALLGSTLSATGNLLNTVNYDISIGMFSQSQSIAISGILGGIGSTMANISAMIGGSIGLPDTGEFPGY